MKRFSLKLKLTAMYSFFMVLVTCLCLAVLFSLSGNEILTSAQMHLRERVQESADEIELEDGEFEIDSDFYSLDNNVYLALYDTGGNFLYGKIPPGLEQAPQFEDGKIQTVKSGTEQWYVYDVQYEMENGQEFYIRGVVSVTETQKEFLIAVRFAVILLPLTVILTALMGYRLIRRTLLPVRQMTETVQEIQKDGDLSRRIGVSQATGKDEFYQLAGTFDGMLESLIDAGAFDKNAAGMTDNIAMTQFQQGEAAMVITGPWNIGTFEDPAETPVCDSIEVAKFPYFEEKPEFKNEDMQTLSPYMISGKLEGKELELTLELVKMLTDKDAAKRFAEEAAFLIPRTDIDLDESAISPLFAKNVELGGTSEGIGVDVFDFDPLASMQDRTRNSISSMFTGEKPDSVAKEIQSEIDK